MVTVNSKDNALYKSIRLKDIIGFALSNGYFLIDQHSNYLVSFWENDITCDVEDLSDKDIDMDSTLEELVTAFNICSVDDILKVFTDESDFTLNLSW
jgi:hypothetical protein